MLTHRGFSAWITSEGTPLPEYLTAVDPHSHRVSCWIPSEEGKTFTVHWRDHGGKVDSCSFITLDGFVVPGRFLFGTGVASRQGVRSGNHTERPFVFSKVEETQNESTSEAAGKDVGMIILRIKRVERIGHRAANGLQSIPQTKGNRVVGDHCVGFGKDKQSFFQYPQTWSVKIKDKPSTYITFIFRYRSSEFLMAQGIMPEPDPAPTIPVKREHPVRRIASAPTTPLMSGPMTPSPSPSPGPGPMKKVVKFVHTVSTAKQEFLGKGKAANMLFRGPTRVKQVPDMHRSITMGGDRFPGQGMLLFNAGLQMSNMKGEGKGEEGQQVAPSA